MQLIKMRDRMNFFTNAWDSDLVWSFRQAPLVMVAALMTTVIVLAAVLAPLIVPHDPFNPATLNLMDGFTPPMTPNAM